MFLVNILKILRWNLIFFLSMWYWIQCNFIKGDYPCLFLFVFINTILFFIDPSTNCFSFYVPKFLRNLINIKIVYFFLYFVLFGMLVSFSRGESSAQFFLKFLLLPMVPLTFWAIYYRFVFLSEEIKKIVFYTILFSCMWQLIFSFILGHYDYSIGKIHECFPGYFTFSSNTLSIYMVYTITVFGLIYLQYYSCSKSYLLKLILIFLPLLHFSKAHLVSYISSFIVSGVIVYRNLLKKLLGIIWAMGMLTFSIYIVYHNYDYLNSVIANPMLKRLLVADKLFVDAIIGNISLDLWSFITQVGDPGRTYYFQTYLNALNKAIFIGYGDRADILLLHGADYHNMIFFFGVQYGITAVLGWYGLMLYLLYIGIYKWRYLNKFLVFSVIYWILRSLFSTLSPYRFIVFVLFLAIIEANIWYREVSRYESHNLS